jgi:hypothetical protein
MAAPTANQPVDAQPEAFVRALRSALAHGNHPDDRKDAS